MAIQCKFVFFAGILLIAGAAAHVMRRDVGTQAGDEHVFSNLFTEAQQNLKSLEAKISQALGFNSPEELREKAAEQGKAIANRLDDWTKSLKEQTESLKDNESVKELRNTIDKAVNDWKADHPQTTNDVEKFLASTKENSEKILDQIKKIDESEHAKQIKELSEKLLTSSVQTLQDVAKKIDENLKTH